jgi:hypothetical protein
MAEALVKRRVRRQDMIRRSDVTIVLYLLWIPISYCQGCSYIFLGSNNFKEIVQF